MSYKQTAQAALSMSNNYESNQKLNSKGRQGQDQEEEEDKYFILESQVAENKWASTYKCQMNDKSERVGFVKIYNKNQIEATEKGTIIIQRIYHSIYVLQNFQGSTPSAHWIPKFLGKREDSDSIEVITEYVQDNLADMIEQKQIYTEDDAIFLLKCILLSLYEMHHIKNVFNASECYLNVGITPKSLLFTSDSRDSKEQVMFSNSGDLYQEEDLKKRNSKEIESIVKINDYSAPETLKHKRVTKESNLWSVGCIFYEMLFNEKFIEIDKEKGEKNKEGINDCYQEMKYQSETLRSNLICKSNSISNFSILCLQGLLAFNPSDRYTWQSIKQQVFSLDLTKSIHQYDLTSINRSYVSNNSLWISRARPTPFQNTPSAKKYLSNLNTNNNNVYMSFTDNNSVIQEGNEEPFNSFIAKSMNKSIYNLSISDYSNNFNTSNNNFYASNNQNKNNNNKININNNTKLNISSNSNNNWKSRMLEPDNFLKESFMNGILKKSLINGNEENQIEYMKKSKNEKLGQQNQQSGNQAITMLQSFALNGNVTTNIEATTNQLSQNNSFTDEFYFDTEEQLKLQFHDNQEFDKKQFQIDQSLYKSELNRSKMSNISKASNISKVNDTKKNVQGKDQGKEKTYIQKYQLEMPKMSELKHADQQNNNNNGNKRIQNAEENDSQLSDNKSLFKHIEQHKIKQQKYSPLLDQYNSTQQSEISEDFGGCDFLDNLMAQRGTFNPDIDFNSDLSSNRSQFIQQVMIGKGSQEGKSSQQFIHNTKNDSNISTVSLTQKITGNQQAMSIFDLSHSPYHKNTVKMSNNMMMDENNRIEQSSNTTISKQNENGQKTKVYSEVRKQTSNNEKNIYPQIVYSEVPTPSASQMKYYRDESSLQKQKEHGGFEEVQSKYINASDLKCKLDDQSRGGYNYDEEPILMSGMEKYYQTPQQQQYMVFDELVSNDELACSYILNTRMRDKMGIELDHLQRVFLGEAQHEVQGNQSFTSARGYAKQVFYDKKNQCIVQQERRSSLVRSQVVKAAHPPISMLKDIILKDSYKPFSRNEELFVFSTFFDPFEFKIQGYFQVVLQKTEEIFKHFNNEECLNSVIVSLSLFRVRLFHLIFKQLTEEAQKNNRDSALDGNQGNKTNKNSEEEDYYQLSQSIKQEMKEKVSQDKNIKHLDEVIVQFLKRSTLERGKDLIEPHIYTIYRKHLFNFYNFLTKKIYDSTSESKKELKLPYDRLVQMSRLAFHILILSHYQKVFKLYFKELFTSKSHSQVNNLYSYVEDKIAYMDIFQLQAERNNLKSFLNIKPTHLQALPEPNSPQNRKQLENKSTSHLLPPSNSNNNNNNNNNYNNTRSGNQNYKQSILT